MDSPIQNFASRYIFTNTKNIEIHVWPRENESIKKWLLPKWHRSPEQSLSLLWFLPLLCDSHSSTNNPYRQPPIWFCFIIKERLSSLSSQFTRHHPLPEQPAELKAAGKTTISESISRISPDRTDRQPYPFQLWPPNHSSVLFSIEFEERTEKIFFNLCRRQTKCACLVCVGWSRHSRRRRQRSKTCFW